MLINALNRLLCNTNAVFLSIQGKGLKLLTEKERFIALCEEIHRDGIGELMNWLESSDFYTAPASTRYHGSRPGGLLTHSINVYEELKRILQIYPDVDVSEETVAIVSLFTISVK